VACLDKYGNKIWDWDPNNLIKIARTIPIRDLRQLNPLKKLLIYVVYI